VVSAAGWAGTAVKTADRIPTAQTYRIHAHSAIYNIYDGQVPRQYAGQVMAWFQEIKRDLITADSKDALVEPSSLIGPGCWDI
jgi:hypothetical protein